MKEGDRILFGKYSGTEIKIDGEDFLIMREEEVLGVVTGAPRKKPQERASGSCQRVMRSPVRESSDAERPRAFRESISAPARFNDNF